MAYVSTRPCGCCGLLRDITRISITTTTSPTTIHVVGESGENENDDGDGDGVGGVFIQKGGDGLGEGAVLDDGGGLGDGDGAVLDDGDGAVLDVYVSLTESSYSRGCVLPQFDGSQSSVLGMSTSSFIYYTKPF